MERVVRRAELVSSDDGSAGSSSDDEMLRGRNVFGELEFEEKLTPNSKDTGREAQQNDMNDDEDLEFNLFAPSTTTAQSGANAAPVQKVRLRSPSIDANQNQGFIQPNRNQSYYFTTPDPASKAGFASTALSGAQILATSDSPRPGSTYPWKVLHLPSSQHSKAAVASASLLFRKLIDQGAVSSGKRTRPGKKYRIRIRMKKAAVAKRELEKVAAEEAREAEFREKKTRRNREKKVKKRARDKAKKVAGGEAVAEEAAAKDDSQAGVESASADGG